MVDQKKIRILLAEDHPVVLAGTRNILKKRIDFQVVGEACDGQKAIELAKSLEPDILLCDIRLPSVNGIEVVRAIRKILPNIRCVVLTAYDDDEYISEAMRAGASGYLMKTVNPHDLVEAIRKVDAGETVLDPEVAVKIARLSAEEASPRNRGKQLSERQKEVLNLARSGLKNKDIAEKLNLSVRTVEKHFEKVIAKLAVSSRLEAILHGSK